MHSANNMLRQPFTTTGIQNVAGTMNVDITSHPKYIQLRQRGYTDVQIKELIARHGQQQTTFYQHHHPFQHQYGPTIPSIPPTGNIQHSSTSFSTSTDYNHPYQPQHTSFNKPNVSSNITHTNTNTNYRPQTIAYVSPPPTPSIDDSTMFKFSAASDARRFDSVPLQFHRSPQDVIPRANIQLQTKPDKSTMEEVYQNIYQSRQTEVQQTQIPVANNRGHRQSPSTSPGYRQPQQQQQQQHRTSRSPFPPPLPDPLTHYPKQHSNTANLTTPPSQPKASHTSHHRHATSPEWTTQHERRRAFENEMDRLKQDEAAAFELLQMPREYDLRLLAKQYRKAALKYHPDRLRKHAEHMSPSQRASFEGMFEKVTKAYLLLMERHTEQEENRPFYELRKESRQAMDNNTTGTTHNHSKNSKNTHTQTEDHESARTSDNGRIRLGKGDQFNLQLFNKIYNDHRLHAPTDNGYGEWLKHDTDDPPTTLFSSKFNKDVFNTTFEQLKRDDPHAEHQLIKHEEMGVIVHGNNTAFSTLGEGGIDDYGGNTASLQYSDLKSAHTTHATLIDASRVQRENPSFRSIKDLEAHRSRVSHDMSPEEAERQARIQKQLEVEEEERRQRVRHMDQLGADQERRLGRLLLQ